jgi:hypothetical protein
MNDITVDLESLLKKIKKTPSKQVSSARIKSEVRRITKKFYDEFREKLGGQKAEDVEILDGAFQELYRLTSIRAAKSNYLAELNAAIEASRRLEFDLLSKRSSGGAIKKNLITDKEEKILATLEKSFPSAGLCFKQGLSDLAEDRISWRGAAVEFREALREVLDSMAKDVDVMAAPGFKFEKDGSGHDFKVPTQKQKATYIFRNRHGKGLKAQIPIDTLATVDGMVGGLVRSVYSLGSVHTHTTAGRREVVRVKEYVVILLGDLLEIGN